MEFKTTPKGYFYIDGKRVSKETYQLKEIQCKSFDTFLSRKGYSFKNGRLK
jgi:hypothetical protein